MSVIKFASGFCVLVLALYASVWWFGDYEISGFLRFVDQETLRDWMPRLLATGLIGSLLCVLAGIRQMRHERKKDC